MMQYWRLHKGINQSSSLGAYLYILNNLGIQWVIVRVGWDFCCAVLEEIFLPGKTSIMAVVSVTFILHPSRLCVWENYSFLTTGVSQRGLSRAGQCAPYAQWAFSTAFPLRWPSAIPYTPVLLSIGSAHPGKTRYSLLYGPSLGLKRRKEKQTVRLFKKKKK